jgi:hypothetical protein
MGVDGTLLPGGTYRLAAGDNERLCSALGAVPDPDGRAHPLFFYVATQVGMGASVPELLRLCDFDVAEGPLMTGSVTTMSEDLKVGLTYSVDGQILSLVRKPSRAFGAADWLRFRLRLRCPEGRLVGECVNEWILPRRGAARA